MRLFLAALILSASFIVAASHTKAYFEHLSIEDGLSQSSVYQVLQDNKGFMWFATQDGLNRFDGYDFKTFVNLPTEADSLSSSHIRVIFLDHRGRLWAGSDKNGLNLYQAETGRFIRYQHDINDPNSISHNEIRAIHEDNQGQIWVGTYGGGLNRFDESSQTFEHIRAGGEPNEGLLDDNVNVILSDKKGHLWLGTDGGLTQFDPTQNTFQHFRQDSSDNYSLPNDQVNTLLFDIYGKLWVGSADGLSQFDANTRQFHRYPLDGLTELHVTDLLWDSNDVLWVSTYGGGIGSIVEQEGFVHYQHRDGDQHSLSDNHALSLFEDSQGALWVGTLGGGLNQLNRQRQVFSHIKRESGISGSLSNNVIRSVYKDSNKVLWIGTHDGVNRLDESQGVETPQFTHIGIADGLVNNTVLSIVEDQQGFIWIGTAKGLERYDPQNGQIRHYQNDPNDLNSLGHNYIRILFKDSQGTIWLGTEGGLNQYQPQQDSFKRFEHSSGDNTSISHDSIRSIFEDAQGVIWVGTIAGLNRFDAQSQTFTRFSHSSRVENSLSHDFITSIYQHSRGDLWITTYGGGLNRYDHSSGLFSHYSEKDGLANNHLYGLLEDNQGQLWLSSNKGLSRFNPVSERFRNYDRTDGLQSNEFNYGAHFKSSDGELFFGGINGFNRFFAENLPDDTVAPQVVLTDFLLANQSVAITRDEDEEQFTIDKNVEFLDQITLSYRENLIAFDFAALHFTHPEKNQYGYWLEGQDKGWIMTDAQHRRATYTNLAPGKYNLRLKAANHNGYWREREKQLQLIVLPPPWKTWWAYCIYITMFLLPLVAYLHYQQKKMRYKEMINDRLEQQVKERSIELELKSREIIETQQKLVQSEKLASLGTLTAGVAHEVNNPNNFVNLSTQVLETELNNFKSYLVELAGQNADQAVLESFENHFEPLYHHVNTIRDGSERIKTIVQGLRTFTQLGSAEYKGAKVSELIIATVNLVKAQYKRNIEFEMDFEQTPMIDCYPAKLNQVFMNLIVNACHAIEQFELDCCELEDGNNGSPSLTTHGYKGKITINCKVLPSTLDTEAEEMLKISIADNGCGMTEETKHKLFEPFYTTKGVGQGTGLGLSISYGIIQQHKGELEVLSELGVGSTFLLRLPLLSKLS